MEDAFARSLDVLSWQMKLCLSSLFVRKEDKFRHPKRLNDLPGPEYGSGILVCKRIWVAYIGGSYLEPDFRETVLRWVIQ